MSREPCLVTFNMHSYVTPGVNSADRNSHTHDRLFWLEVYDAIRARLRISIAKDLEAVQRVLAYAHTNLDLINNCCALIARSHRICVVGCSAELEEQVEILKYCDLIIAADGAAGLLLEHGVFPHIIVGDLDGAWWPVLMSVQRGSIAIVTVHGDNEELLRSLIPLLPKHSYAIVGQVDHPQVPVTPGFTDGDKAVWLAVSCAKPSSEVILIGMNFRGLVGRWSKPWLKDKVSPWPSKREKLHMAEIITRMALRLAEAKGVAVEAPDRLGQRINKSS